MHVGARGPSLTTLLRSDLERHYFYTGRPGRQPRRRELWRNFLIPRLAPVALYRLARAAQVGRWRRLAKLLTWLNFYLHNIEIAATCEIGPGFYMPHAAGSVIGAMRIGHSAVIYHQVTIGAKRIMFEHAERPVIGDEVFIAAGAKVIGDIEIGDRCVIGANAVVTKSAPADRLLTGIPATASPRRIAADRTGQ